MSQIRSDILYHRQKKKAKKTDTKIQRLHLAIPIVEDDNLNNPEFDNLSENNLQVSEEACKLAIRRTMRMTRRLRFSGKMRNVHERPMTVNEVFCNYYY